MSKPKGEKCKTCFVVNNRLRCSLCKWKTEEWFWNQPPTPITISGDEDLYKENGEQKSKLDLISRQAAIEVLSHVKEDEKWREECIDNEIRLIKLLPPCTPTEPKRPKGTETMMVDGEPAEIDPLSYEVGYTHGQTERPKGEWKTDMVYAGIEFYRCDQCDFRQSEKSRYCPNCGADCRGDK